MNVVSQNSICHWFDCICCFVFVSVFLSCSLLLFILLGVFAIHPGPLEETFDAPLIVLFEKAPGEQCGTLRDYIDWIDRDNGCLGAVCLPGRWP